MLKKERRMNVNLTEMAERQYGISMLPESPVYAMAYIPFQAEDSKLFSPNQGFSMGTMYPGLNKPFCGGKCGDCDE